MTAETSPASASGIAQGDHVFLVDGSSYIFRAYHALPPLTRKSDGLPVGAVAGFCNMLWKLLQEGDPTREGVFPTHLGVIFDHSGHSFRNAIFDAYKANRSEPPEDLVPQFGLIREAVRAFSVACIEQEGFEADDLIATYAGQARAAGADVTIVASDKDLMQLIGEGVAMVDTLNVKARGVAKRIEAGEVFEKFGVAPDKVIDVQALAGDSTDNIPGVPGIGVKTAAQLIGDFGDLESLLAKAETITQTKRRENLLQFAGQARISMKLVTLDRAVPVEVGIGTLGVEPCRGADAVAFLKAMEFTTLTRRVAEVCGVDVEEVAPAEVEIRGWEGSPKPSETVADAPVGGPVDATPQALAAAVAAHAINVPCSREAYVAVTTLDDLELWANAAREQGYVAVDTETDSLVAMHAGLVGFSLALTPGNACYVPLQHVSGDGLDFDGAGVAEQCPLDEALAILKSLMEDAAVLKIGQNLKFDIVVLGNHGIEVANTDDTLLMSYALDSGHGGHGMDELARRHLGHDCIPFKEVAGSGKAMVTFDRVAIDKATEYAAEDADVTLRLWQVLKPRLAAEHVTAVYERLERPMSAVLAQMERAGVHIDRQMLSRLSGTFAQKMGALEAEIHDLAGEDFNLGSPKQLGEILYGKMGIAGGKKTKSGAWSTDASTLEELAAQGHTLPEKLLEWRQLSKLKSTYTDSLPTYIHPRTGRIHTSYALAATSTGRLASAEPNLQNIPVRTAEGREIRKAFTAEPGNVLISADYSQIELRVLAHMADIGALKSAFADGLDIHAMTASEMFNTPIEGMDPGVRRRAKAINFGIIYGISAFGLANQLRIPRGEAADYIARYFERFPGIRDYMEAMKAAARRDGYVTTLFGRKMHFPEINTRNPAHRGFMERAAINAPIQGSAADIIRRAMIRMATALEEAGHTAKMLMQVHDELVFEAPEGEADATIATVRDVMETACAPSLQLSVPLAVDAKAAANWEAAH